MYYVKNLAHRLSEPVNITVVQMYTYTNDYTQYYYVHTTTRHFRTYLHDSLFPDLETRELPTISVEFGLAMQTLRHLVFTCALLSAALLSVLTTFHFRRVLGLLKLARGAVYQDKNMVTTDCLTREDKLVLENLELYGFTKPDETVCFGDGDSIPIIKWPWNVPSPSSQSTPPQMLPKHCSGVRQVSTTENGFVLSADLNVKELVDTLGCQSKMATTGVPRAAMCLIIRNDAPQLAQWILHHLLVGFEHIYIFDDCSADNFDEVVAPYIRAGHVTVLPMDNIYARLRGNTRPEVGPQMLAYTHCSKNFAEKHDYIAFLDSDEFLTPLRDQCITSTLRHMDSVNAGGISVQAVEMGNDGDIVAPHHCKIRTDVLGPQNTGYNMMAKTLCHTRRSHGTTGPHCCSTIEGFPVMYALDSPTAIDQGGEEELCFDYGEEYRGRWNETWVFIQHCPRISLYDLVMKDKRNKYGTSHPHPMYHGHLSIHESYIKFMGGYRLSSWKPQNQLAAEIRSNISNALSSAFKLSDERLKRKCQEIERRTKAMHAHLSRRLNTS